MTSSGATLLNEHNIFTQEISPDLLFQNKNPHDESITDPTSNSEYSNKNVLISSENSEPSSSQEPENNLLLLCKQKKSNHNRLIFSTFLNFCGVVV